MGDVVIEDSPGLKSSRADWKEWVDQAVHREEFARGGGERRGDGDRQERGDHCGRGRGGIGSGDDTSGETPGDAAGGEDAGSAKLETLVEKDGKTVQVSLAGDMGDEVAYVTFEAADRFDYLLGAPVIVTEKPWTAVFKPGKHGPITFRATVTRSGGDPDKAIVGVVLLP